MKEVFGTKRCWGVATSVISSEHGAPTGMPDPAAGAGSAPDRAAPDLSIVIVTHNGCTLAVETIESAMSHVGDIGVEWVIVDSGSTDGTPEVIEARWPQIKVTRLANVGFAAANNVGFARATGRYLLALNPDTCVRWGRLQALIAALDARPQVGAASVIQEEADGSLQSIRRDPTVGRALSEALLLRRLPGMSRWQERELDQTVYGEERSVDWLVGAVLVLRREALQDVGGFDERFFMYSEEADLCRRVRAAGWEVRHLPVMRILHYGGAPSPRLIAQASFSRLEYASKHFGHIRAKAYRAALALHHLVRLTGNVARRGPAERRAGELHALRVVLGLAQPPFASRRCREPSASNTDGRPFL
jgi:GT2 family glycosyltransferase